GNGGLVDARAFIHADTPLSTAVGGTPPSRTSSCDSVTPPPLNEPVHSPPTGNIQRSIDRSQTMLRQAFTNQQQQVGVEDEFNRHTPR
ncbi:unnamed protein product, partial [Sphagnum balticum]